MRVLRVSERIPPLAGGKEIHVLELTREQVASGFDVTTLFRKGDPALVAGKLRRVGPPRPFRNIRGLAGTSLFAIAARRELSNIGDVDVVHLHGDLAEAIAFGQMRGLQPRATVLTVHGSLNSRYRSVSSIGFGGIDHFIALGDAAHLDLVNCGVADRRITTMSSGLNFNLLRGAMGKRERDRALVVSVGSLNDLKNHSATISAVRQLRGVVDLRLEIIGSGPLEAQLRQEARDLQNVTFHGQMSREATYELVAKASAFVIASKRTSNAGEGVPTSLLEALALGTPCLVSDAASPAAVVHDRSAYVTFNPNCSAELAQSLIRVLSNAELAQQMSDNGIRAVSHLGWEDVASRVSAVYDQAIQEGSRGGKR